MKSIFCAQPVYFLFSFLLSSHLLSAQPDLIVKPFLSGFSRPTKIVHANDSRLFVAESTGKIKVVRNGQVLSSPFLDIGPKVNSPEWSGIFSIAFHPDYSSNGYFYVMYALVNSPVIRVSRFARVGSAASDLASSAETIVLDIPYALPTGHKGGDMAFGTDGFLYLTTGDDGPGGRGELGDPGNNSQNPGNLFGKILRLNVDGPLPVESPLSLIWASGLRNPWRMTFDRQNGDMWIGDNGQDGWEEIDVLRSGQTLRNFGWPFMEGDAVYRSCSCDPPSSFVAPFLTFPGYTHNGQTSASVVGGYVYRGAQYPALQGWYFYGDYSSFKIGAARASGSGFKGFLPGVTYPSVVSFGEGNDGELYLLSFFEGTIAQLTTSSVLPVKLEQLTARQDENGNVLNWRTSMESDFSHFEVERSIDLKSWSKLASVNGGSGPDYRYTDNLNGEGSLYYRLRMVDLDGSSSYSRSVSVYRTPENLSYPNPVTGQIIVSAKLEEHAVMMSDLSGRTIPLSPTQSGENVLVDVRHLPAGVYWLTVTSKKNGVIRRSRLVKH